MAVASSLAAGMPYLSAPPPAHAACSTVPRAPVVFRGVKGSVDRPYVTPGDANGNPENRGGRLVLTLDACQPAELAFRKQDHMVALLFDPPGGGPRHALLLAHKCNDVDVTTCGTQIGALGRARCVETTVNTSSGPGGPNRTLWLDVPETTDASGFPELTGPATIVVTAKTAPACDIGGSAPSCRNAASAEDALICIDELFTTGSCDLDAPQPEFTSFTVLPPINDYRKICGPGGPAPSCSLNEAAKLRFTVDARGNILMPIRWRGILRGKGGSGVCPEDQAEQGACDTRLLVGRSAADADGDTPAPDVIALPSGVAVKSFTMRGVEFEPPPSIEAAISDDGTELVLSGRAHKPKSVLRIPSCSGTGCTPNQFFDFTDRLENGVGAISLTRRGGPGVCDTPGGTRCNSDADCSTGVVCAQFRAQAGDHLPAVEEIPMPPPPPPPPAVEAGPTPVAAPPTTAAPSWIFWIGVAAIVAVASLLLLRMRRS